MVFGNGPGGRFSSDPRRRRCGVAAAVVRMIPGTTRWETGGGVSVISVGHVLAIPRAELLAFALCLEGPRAPSITVGALVKECAQ